MSKHLDVIVFKYYRYVVAQIVNMNENLRGVASFYTEDGSIMSVSYPELKGYINSPVFYIQGNDRTKDNKVIYKRFDNEKEAQKYVDNLLALIDRANEYWNIKYGQYVFSIDDSEYN